MEGLLSGNEATRKELRWTSSDGIQNAEVEAVFDPLWLSCCV
jgi:hypothetical protein